MTRGYVLGLLGVCVAIACAGTETDNPALVSFETSGCKKDNVTTGASGQQSQALTLSSNYDGLKCIAWKSPGEAKLAIELINFEQGCGVDWIGRANWGTDGALELTLVNSNCATAPCGWCIYDWTFEVRGAPAGEDLRVRIGFKDCPTDGGRRPEYEVLLPLTRAAEGVVCRAAHPYALADHARSTEACGGAQMPCENSLACVGTGTPVSCATGLVCQPVTSADDLRCLTSCQSDTDCPLAEAFTCQDGVCRIVEQW